MTFEFFAPLEEIPRTTSQQKGFNRRTGQVYTKAKVRQVKNLYGFIFKTHRPPRIMTGAIRVKVIFFFPAKRPHKHGEPKTTRPDVENMSKELLDAANGVLWADDSQIADLRLIKTYGEECGIYLKAVEIGQGGVERDNDC